MDIDRRNFSLLGVLSIVAAGTPVGMARAADDDAGSVAAAIQLFRSAMVNGDGDTLRTLAEDGLSFGHSNGLVQTKDEFIGSVEAKKEIFNAIDLTHKSLSVAGDLAIERHTFNADITLAGNPLVVSLGVVEVWRKTDNWRLIVRQAFAV